MTRTAAPARRWCSFAAFVTALVVLIAPFTPFTGERAALADSRTDFLAGRLRAEDFRVRTNAALALGQSGDDGAVPPLCAALADDNEVVRQAVAAALKRLGKPAGVPCLQRRLGAERSAAVKLQLTRAIETLQAAAGSDPTPRIVPNAKFYVAVSIANQTERADDEIASVISGAIRAKLDELGGYQLAPDHESPEQARAAMTKRKLKGYYLAIRVEKFDYHDGNLRVRVKAAVFSYPGKDLRGEVPASLTQTGVRPGDKAAEDNLMQMAAGRAIELFAQNFP